jgi:hypothetical protein
VLKLRFSVIVFEANRRPSEQTAVHVQNPRNQCHLAGLATAVIGTHIRRHRNLRPHCQRILCHLFQSLANSGLEGYEVPRPGFQVLKMPSGCKCIAAVPGRLWDRV